MNRYAKAGTVALIVLAFTLGLPTSAHYRAKRKVEAYRQRLRAKGEKLTTSELRPQVSAEALYGAGALLDAAGHLGYPISSNLPPTMKIVAPGRALVAWAQPELPTMDSSNLWPELSRMVAENQGQLDALRAALASPRLMFDLDYSREANLQLGYLSTLKQAAQWLSAAAVLDLHEGRLTNAWADVMALSALAAHSPEEPVMISELVRIAIGSIAFNATWEALQSPAWREEQLSALQAAWESVDLLAQAESVLAMERPFAQSLFADARRSHSVVSGAFGAAPTTGFGELAEMGKEMLTDPKGALSDFAHRYPGYWNWRWWQSYDDELASLESLQAAIEAVRAVRQRHEFAPATKLLAQRLESIHRTHPAAGRWLEFAPEGIIGPFLPRISTFETQRSLLIAAIALKRRQLRHGAYPGELAALAPEFLRGVPRDPIDGQPLRYRLNADGSFLLYSVGQDGQDNGGDPTPAPPAAARQWWQGRDVVWPRPATAEMVKADFEKERIEREKRTSPPLSESARRAVARRYGLRSTPPGPATNTTPPAPAAR
jgi:hypothetical protein